MLVDMVLPLLFLYLEKKQKILETKFKQLLYFQKF